MAATRHLPSAMRLAARYAAISLPMFTFWELAQLPLYTIWTEKGLRTSLWAALHCALGDVAIAFLTLVVALMSTDIVVPGSRTIRSVAVITILSGVFVTAAIEIGSTQWLERWSYAPLMPVDPFFGIGLSPLAQWIVVPASALFVVRRRLAQLVRG